MNADRLDQLWARVRAGDDTAYGQFLAKAADRLRADLRRQVPGEDALEDVVRQCLIALHRKRHTLDANRPAGPWLSAIGHYQMVKYWRKHRTIAARPLEADATGAMARLVSLDRSHDTPHGAQSAAILAAMMLRVRRAVRGRPDVVERR